MSQSDERESLGTEKLPSEPSSHGHLTVQSVSRTKCTHVIRAQKINHKADIPEHEGPEDGLGGCGLLQRG